MSVAIEHLLKGPSSWFCDTKIPSLSKIESMTTKAKPRMPMKNRKRTEKRRMVKRPPIVAVLRKMSLSVTPIFF
jgi:hypothetical protein